MRKDLEVEAEFVQSKPQFLSPCTAMYAPCIPFFLYPNLDCACLRMSETRRNEVYEELPLFEIEEKWGGSASGKNLGGI
jgi:hypothetical protein